MEEEMQKSNITALVRPSNDYVVYKQENRGRVFYKISIAKKNCDGQITKAYVQVKFAKCEPVPNGTLIKITKAMEDWYKNPKDTWNIIPVIVIFEYEIIETSASVAENAIKEYNQSNDDNSEYELPY